jgi:hypothetical protein
MKPESTKLSGSTDAAPCANEVTCAAAAARPSQTGMGLKTKVRVEGPEARNEQSQYGVFCYTAGEWRRWGGGVQWSRMLPHLRLPQRRGQRLLDALRPCLAIAPLVLEITKRPEGNALSIWGPQGALQLPDAIHAPSVAEAVAEHKHRALMHRISQALSTARG